MRLSLPSKIGKFRGKLIQTENLSPEYQQWRHRFILKRLHLMTWVAIIVWSIIAIANLSVTSRFLDPSNPQYDFVRQNYWLLWSMMIAEFLQFWVGLLLLKIPWFRRYPLLIFAWLILTLFFTKQIFYAIFLGQIILAENTWIRSFAVIAILMPVRWRWYLIAQIIVLGHFAISYLVFGLREASVESGLEYFQGVYSTIVVFVIINLGVFLYERLLQQEFELKRQLRLFIYTVSHDLRSPILGTMFLLKSLRNPAAKKTLVENEIIDRVVDSSDRQLQLIDSLLEAHNTETQGIAIRPRPVCLSSLVQSVVAEMQPLLVRQQATIAKTIPTELPLANIDPLQIRRVYENLINNALEYNRSGLHLTLEVERNGSIGDRQKLAKSKRWLYCTVRDNGIGISPQKRSNIFNLYTRAASNKQSLSVGLGLYICRQIINAHGGEIGINDTQKGASFWFTLPTSAQTL